MTPVLPRIDSESTVGGGIYEDNEAVTNLLPHAGQIVQDFGYQRPRWPWVVDDTRPTIESTELLLRQVSDYLEVLIQDEPGLVRGEIRKPLLPEYQASATPLLEVLEFRYAFVPGRLTSPGDNILDQFTIESTSPGRAEGIPQMLSDALDVLYEVKAVALEEECDEPSDLAINNAEAVLRQMFDASPRIYDIYPMGGGEIVIDAGYGERRIGVFCYPDGRMQYVGLLDEEPEEVREDSAENIPTDFLRRVLNQLDP